MTWYAWITKFRLSIPIHYSHLTKIKLLQTWYTPNFMNANVIPRCGKIKRESINSPHYGERSVLKYISRVFQISALCEETSRGLSNRILLGTTFSTTSENSCSHFSKMKYHSHLDLSRIHTAPILKKSMNLLHIVLLLIATLVSPCLADDANFILCMNWIFRSWKQVCEDTNPKKW